MSPIWIDKFIFSWTEMANGDVEDKIKRMNFPVLHSTLIFEKQLKPCTCQVLKVQGQVEQSSSSPAETSLESRIVDGSTRVCACLNKIVSPFPTSCV